MNRSKKRNLFVLRRGIDARAIHVVGLDDNQVKEQELTLDLKNNSWFTNRASNTVIGNTHLSGPNFPCAIIGIYDRTNDEHLNSMVNLIRRERL